MRSVHSPGNQKHDIILPEQRDRQEVMRLAYAAAEEQVRRSETVQRPVTLCAITEVNLLCACIAKTLGCRARRICGEARTRLHGVEVLRCICVSRGLRQEKFRGCRAPDGRAFAEHIIR